MASEHVRCPVCGLVVPEADLVTSEEIVADTPVDVSDLPGVKSAGIRTVHVQTLGCRRCMPEEPIN